jgi:hypothetical protein
MSLMGDKVAVVSLGMCCQSTFQIRHHAKLIAELSGDPTAKISGMPFDGLICSPEAAIKMLREKRFYPERMNELTILEGAYWKEVDAHFWHEFRASKKGLLNRGKLDPERAYRDLVEKYSYMSAKFCGLSTVPRLIFVICNTQNNLPLVAKLTGTVDYVLDLESICDLAAQTDEFFGRRCEYVFATYEKWARGVPVGDNVSIYRLSPDDSDWQGDPAQWEGVFRQTFSPLQ